MRKCLAAHTPPGFYPPYVNFTLDTDGAKPVVQITVRSPAGDDGACGETAMIPVEVETFKTLMADAAAVLTTDSLIKHMVDRFLAWRLPDNFSPDAGISFKPEFNEHTAHPMKHEPVGTNLLDASQAEAMVRHLIEGMPRTL